MNLELLARELLREEVVPSVELFVAVLVRLVVGLVVRLAVRLAWAVLRPLARWRMRRRVRWLSLNFVVFVLLVLGRVLIFRNAVSFLMRRERTRVDVGGDATRLQQYCQCQEKCETKKPSAKLHETIPGGGPIQCLLSVGLPV